LITTIFAILSFFLNFQKKEKLPSVEIQVLPQQLPQNDTTFNNNLDRLNSSIDILSDEINKIKENVDNFNKAIKKIESKRDEKDQMIKELLDEIKNVKSDTTINK
jgi:peptidoglycan hydrolase CwlO-like protein